MLPVRRASVRSAARRSSRRGRIHRCGHRPRSLSAAPAPCTPACHHRPVHRHHRVGDRRIAAGCAGVEQLATPKSRIFTSTSLPASARFRVEIAVQDAPRCAADRGTIAVRCRTASRGSKAPRALSASRRSSPARAPYQICAAVGERPVVENRDDRWGGVGRQWASRRNRRRASGWPSRSARTTLMRRRDRGAHRARGRRRPCRRGRAS